MLDFLGAAFNFATIINALVAALIFELFLSGKIRRLFRSKVAIADSPGEVGKSEEPPQAPKLVSRAEKNRDILYNIVMYFLTYLIVYFSIQLPPSLSADLSGNPVFLSQAKSTGFLLPNIQVTLEFFQPQLALLVFIIYLPLFFLASLVTSFIVLPILGVFVDEIHRRTQIKINAGILFVSSVFLLAFGFTEFFDVEFKLVLAATTLLFCVVIGEATRSNGARN